jgi:hypothetical protein
LNKRTLFKIFLDINIGMEESGSENLDVELAKRKETFLKVFNF